MWVLMFEEIVEELKILVGELEEWNVCFVVSQIKLFDEFYIDQFKLFLDNQKIVEECLQY